MTESEEPPLHVFWHHPDPSTDFCCEIDMLEGWLANIAAGIQSQWPFWRRLSRARRFVRQAKDLHAWALAAIPILDGMETRCHQPPPGTLCIQRHPTEPHP